MVATLGVMLWVVVDGRMVGGVGRGCNRLSGRHGIMFELDVLFLTSIPPMLFRIPLTALRHTWCWAMLGVPMHLLQIETNCEVLFLVVPMVRV